MPALSAEKRTDPSRSQGPLRASTASRLAAPWSPVRLLTARHVRHPLHLFLHRCARLQHVGAGRFGWGDLSAGHGGLSRRHGGTATSPARNSTAIYLRSSCQTRSFQSLLTAPGLSQARSAHTGSARRSVPNGSVKGIPIRLQNEVLATVVEDELETRQEIPAKQTIGTARSSEPLHLPEVDRGLGNLIRSDSEHLHSSRGHSCLSVNGTEPGIWHWIRKLTHESVPINEALAQYHQCRPAARIHGQLCWKRSAIRCCQRAGDKGVSALNVEWFGMAGTAVMEPLRFVQANGGTTIVDFDNVVLKNSLTDHAGKVRVWPGLQKDGLIGEFSPRYFERHLGTGIPRHFRILRTGGSAGFRGLDTHFRRPITIRIKTVAATGINAAPHWGRIVDSCLNEVLMCRIQPHRDHSSRLLFTSRHGAGR